MQERPNLNVVLAGIPMKNPVMVASGTFGFGLEYRDLVDLRMLGAIVTKSVTLEPRAGNPPPRVVETPAGLLNSIGLANPGVKVFIEEILPSLRVYEVPIIVSIAGHCVDDYVRLTEAVCQAGGASGLELNVSCPNVERGTIFGQDPKLLYNLVRSVKKSCTLPCIVKLTPAVRDVKEVALAAEAAGADAISLVNTFRGMVIDTATGRPVLGTGFGGLSGPAIRPMALAIVWEASGAVKLPVIGMGGIVSGDDVVQFLMAGASVVAVGAITLREPAAAIRIISELEQYMVNHRVKDVKELVGRARLNWDQ